MRKNRIFIFIGLLLVILFGVGYSSYVLINENNESLGNDNYIVLDYNDGVTTDVVYNLSSSMVFNPNSDDVVTPNSAFNHEFVGWYTTKTGFNEDGSSSLYGGETLSRGQKLYAKYVNNDTSAFSHSLNVSVTVSPSSNTNGQQICYLSSYSDSNNLSSYITITESGSIYVESSQGRYSDSTQSTSQAFTLTSEADTIVVLDSNLILEGNMEIAAILGGNSGNLQAKITSSFAALDLNGYTILIRNGGSLNGYGIIFNSKDEGGIIVDNGSITTPFLVYGFKGGGITGECYANAVSPFMNYLTPYLACETIFTKNGFLYGKTSLYANSEEHVTVLNLIGNSSDFLIQIINGYVIRRQTSYQELTTNYLMYPSLTTFYDLLDTSYRESIIFSDNPSEKTINLNQNYIDSYKVTRANIEINELVLKVSINVIITTINLNVSMMYVDFPIPSFMDIYMYNTDFSFKISLVFMPGSSCYVDETSIISLGSTYNEYRLFAKISALESYPLSHVYKYTNSNNQTSSYGYLYSTSVNSYSGQFYNSLRLALSARPAVINILGEIQFTDLTNVSFNNYYSYYTLGGNINLSDKALDSIKENHNYLKLATYAGNYIYYGGDNYNIELVDYNTSPLISNGKAYIQLSNQGEIVECSSFDEENKIFNVGNQSYFYYFTVRTNSLVSCGVFDLTSYQEHPGTTNTNNKYHNLDGNYVACTTHYLNNNNQNMMYVTYNGSNYVKVNGAYVLTRSTPTLDSNNRLSNVSLTNNEKFTINGESGSYSRSSEAYFDDVFLNEWRLVL